MSSSDAEICNLALSFCGDTKTIQDLATEQSPQAIACRVFYESTRDELLATFPWTFAKQSEELSLVEEDPNSDWSFSYRYPAACLFPRRIMGDVRNSNLSQRIKFDIGSDATGSLIYTDQEDAVLEYTARIEDVSKWPQTFAIAVAYLLASRIIMRLTGGKDPLQLSPRLQNEFLVALSRATAFDQNSRRPDAPPESEIITSRGGY